MKFDLNEVRFAGRVTDDPVTKVVGATSVTNFSMAANKEWVVPGSAEKGKSVCFMTCEAWGKRGEVVQKYVKKGDPLYVSGELKQHTWKDDATQKNRSRITLNVLQVKFLTSKPAGEAPAQPAPSSPGVPPKDWNQPTGDEGAPEPQPDEDVPAYTGGVDPIGEQNPDEDISF